MIVDEIKIDAVLGDYHLGGRSPPQEVAERLLGMRVPLKAIWNGDSCRWEIYRITKDKLLWQITAPSGDLTSGIVAWLQKKDSSKSGTRDDDERVKDFEYWFKYVQVNKDKEKKEKAVEESMYMSKDINQFLKRRMGGHRQCVVPAGQVVGRLKNGKAVRAYKKW